MIRVGQNHIYIRCIYGVYTVFLRYFHISTAVFPRYFHGISTVFPRPYFHGISTVFPYIYGVYTVFLAGKSPHIRSHTVYIYGSGQPYK
jgi:hypothetical protein